MIDVSHSCEQGVPCYETGCNWLRVEKGIPIGLKQAHSFTMSCLLCNPEGCHGNHMLLQVDMALCQEGLVLHQKTFVQKEILRVVEDDKNKVCVRWFIHARTHTHTQISIDIHFRRADGKIQGNLAGFFN